MQNFNDAVLFFGFWVEISFLGKFGLKSQHYQLRLKFGARTNSNMLNSILMFTFRFQLEISFLGKFGPKNQNYQFKLEFGTYSNSNMQSSMVMPTFFVFDWKYLFWANLVQKVKLISLSWNLVSRLIRICWSQWWCSLFLFLVGNMLFGQIWSRQWKWLA